MVGLVILLIVIGVALWAVNYVLALYIKAEILDLLNKVVIVGTVIYVVIWIVRLLRTELH